MPKYPESAHAHAWLDGLTGIEIGGSAHNPFGLNTRNVDITGDMDTPFKLAEQRICGEKMPVDIVAPGDALPLHRKSVDFVISSHVIEHFHDPVDALREWWRVARHLLYIIVPQRDALSSDRAYPLTTLADIRQRHSDPYHAPVPCDCPKGVHCTRWTLDTFKELCAYYGFLVVDERDPDDKVGNGFAVVIKCCDEACKHPRRA